MCIIHVLVCITIWIRLQGYQRVLMMYSHVLEQFLLIHVLRMYYTCITHNTCIRYVGHHSRPEVI